MTAATQFFAILGAHFFLILFGGLELVAAVILIGALPRRSRRRMGDEERRHGSRGKFGRSRVRGESFGEILEDGLATDGEHVSIIYDRREQLPCFAYGNVERLLGVPLTRLQEDVETVLPSFQAQGEVKRFWKQYLKWDGKTELSTELTRTDGRCYRVFVHRCTDQPYDIFVFQNITELRQRELVYKEKMQEAEEASQFKTSFLFRMSHEIRTPMNGIIGMLTLAKGKLPADHPAMQYLAKADTLSDQLLSLINDILDMSRIEAGKVELEQRPFSLKAFQTKIYDMFAKTLEQKGIHYVVEAEDLTVDWVLGDELRVSQVILNFLSNASKFTEQGEIAVHFHQMLLKDGKVDLAIKVHDTGIGMQPEFLERIFRPFEQEDASTTRRYGGTGLGMAISDQLVKLMGGHIIVESVPGRGSDFTVYLSFPLAEAPAAEEAPVVETTEEETQSAATACHILMAEDNEVNAMIATEILQEKGASIETVGNGQAAVDAFASHPAHFYDLILMDVQMPVMDGRTAARTIRSMERADAKSIPIIALSADAFIEDVRLSKESGMNDHVAKPIDFDALWSLIQTTLSHTV